ncbi:tRNA/rRNA methyltransferase [Thermosulfidibacter takaii ABI70S6]|uniref:tRNA/rRNA methyltransferase n=1 Tax=Thermosulfidibacter takaii (strain DSM 17441 / JCM 13301 / NBRC 103674 / ABI70S6) TaxID=1298851 RepID=A0A0S3QSX5_THET7|nr:RNA methyltransferase [Thermosulfidibacter takaii]BAT71377.1 tRNA/rRNA methyltransferase [Thermosulfidibacter takaii ABI70S6]
MPIAVVMVEPRYPENIGSAARACGNFGIEELVVVAPRILDWEKMLTMATRVGEKVLRNMKVYKNLEEALSDYNYVVGSTARLGNRRRVFKALRDIAPEVSSYSLNNRVALLFGNEKWGLTNEQLYYCHDVFTIPTENNTSLNVAQSIVVTLYEIYCASSNVQLPKPHLATVQEQELMYGVIKEVCERIDYVPHDNTVQWMTSIKRFLTKVDLTQKDVKIILGFCRKLLRAFELLQPR